MNTIQGFLIGDNIKIGIIASRFNDRITSKLIEGSIDTLTRHNTKKEDITVIRVPGAFEISHIAKKALQSKKYNAIICLGAVIRGETPHFNYVASEVTKGIAVLALQYETPIVYGIITADTFDQAFDRAGGKLGNKGSDAALTALEMVNLDKQL